MGCVLPRYPALRAREADLAVRRLPWGRESRTTGCSQPEKVRQEGNKLFKNILVPTDGSDLTAKAVEQALRFAKEIGAKITAVTVTEPFPLAAVAANC